MGQEIDRVSFSAAEHAEFARRLAHETRALMAECAQPVCPDDVRLVGVELEICLVDGKTRLPSMCNQRFLTRLDSPLASAELAQHNAEFNFEPLALRDNMLDRLHAAMRTQYRQARETAQALGCDIALCGILPTLRPSDLNLLNISPLNRYMALNQQVVQAHQDMPFQLDIKGRDHLVRELDSVMMEAATTSLQIHLRLPADKMRAAYNAAQLVSGPIVALCANSPLLFGHDLWAETRIPLFEQAIGLGGFGAAAQGPLQRVSFGSGHIRHSLLECFEENLAHYPVLLPILDDSGARYAHLRLHNGTIWRWNRPIVGFDEDGSVHLRLEHRCLPAGPSLIDMVANIALFIGLVRHYMDVHVEALEFAQVRSNFYQAARFGLRARIDWLDGQRHPVCRLLHHTLLPAAANGLNLLGIDGDDRDTYLGVLERRLDNGQNGAVWQRRFLARYPGEWVALTASMLEQQASDTPVHLWE